MKFQEDAVIAATTTADVDAASVTTPLSGSLSF